MIQMKCLKAMPYGRRDLRPGDEFEATSEKDARVLSIIGKAERIGDEEKAPEIIIRKKRKYNRRDMTAQ